MWVMFRPVSQGDLLPDVQRSQASQSEEPSQSVRRKRGVCFWWIVAGCCQKVRPVGQGNKGQSLGEKGMDVARGAGQLVRKPSQQVGLQSAEVGADSVSQ